jgi:hypothetical protein
VQDTVQTPNAVSPVKQDLHAQANHLAQILGRVIGQLGGCGPFLRHKSGDAESVDRIRLGTRELLFGKAVSPKRFTSATLRPSVTNASE